MEARTRSFASVRRLRIWWRSSGSKRMRGCRIAVLVALIFPIATGARAAIEPWADPSLPGKAGVLLWVDAARQPAAWSAHHKTLADGQAVDVVYDASGRGRDFTQTA